MGSESPLGRRHHDALDPDNFHGRLELAAQEIVGTFNEGRDGAETRLTYDSSESIEPRDFPHPEGYNGAGARIHLYPVDSALGRWGEDPEPVITIDAWLEVGGGKSGRIGRKIEYVSPDFRREYPEVIAEVGEMLEDAEGWNVLYTD